MEQPRSAKTILAFAIVYLVWGSTFLAIRIGVREVPPLILASLRFFPAGLVLFCWTAARRERLPDRGQWASTFLVALLIFAGDYGVLFRAERRVPSGIAAVMMATIPAFLAISEILILRTRKLTPALGFALLIGLAGVAVLTSHSFRTGEAPADAAGAMTLLFAAMNFAIGSVLNRKLPLPKSQMMSSGAQMLAGGALLALAAAASGEFRNFHPWTVSLKAWLCLLYLIVAGSIVAFTAYLWLIHRESPTMVGTYAYVNPVVAVLLGYFAGDEAFGLRTIVGTVCVLVSVLVITKMPSAKTRGAGRN